MLMMSDTMDNQIIYREWPLWIYAQREKDISDSIQKFTDKPSKREKWMARNLMPYLFHGDEPLFTGIERAAVFYRAYHSMNMITKDGSNRVLYKWGDDIKGVYYSKLTPKHIISLDEIKKIQQEIDNNFISCLPPGSWHIHFSFTLSKPYISRDDTDFYIIDNPVKKEWVFKVPYVAPSQWKGALRSAIMQELVSNLRNGKIDEKKFTDERVRLYRLFGNEKDGTGDFLNKALARYFVRSHPNEGQSEQINPETLNSKIKEIAEAFKSELVSRGYKQGDIEGFQGNLHFYPTHFNQIGLQVINPHDRKTGAGKNPIYFECVPEGTNGTFNLLFVPLTGPELSDDETREDLRAVARGVKAMMTYYGFGAKTSSGFGTAEVDPENTIILPDNFKPLWDNGLKDENK